MKKILIGMLFILVVGLISSCSGEVAQPEGDTAPADDTQPEADTTPADDAPETTETATEEVVVEEVTVSGNTVKIMKKSFDPETLEISVGTEVTWMSEDPEQNHVLSIIGEAKSPRLEPGDSFTYQFNEAGTFRVLDVVFGMDMEVIVTE